VTSILSNTVFVSLTFVENTIRLPRTSNSREIDVVSVVRRCYNSSDHYRKI